MTRDLSLRIPTPADLLAAAREFVATMGNSTVFALVAPMGAGKTTFVGAVCEALGVEDVVTSPTFAIVNEYARSGGCGSVFHFDLYRLKDAQELLDIGADDYFYSGQPCFVEWPELADGLLPDDTVYIYISVEDDGTRVVSNQRPK